MAEIIIPEEIGLNESEYTGCLQTMLMPEFGNLEVLVEFFKPINHLTSKELSLKLVPSEVYVNSLLINTPRQRNILSERFLLRRGRRARRVRMSLEEVGSKSYEAVLDASRRDFALLINKIGQSKDYGFANESEPIGVLPNFYSNPIIPTEVDKKGFSLCSIISRKSMPEKVLEKPRGRVMLLDMVNGFNPPVLTHERVTHDLGGAAKRYLGNARGIKAYVNDFSDGLNRFYRKITDSDMKSLKRNFEDLVKEYFMPSETHAVIHNGTPYDNREVSFVNHDNFAIGPRGIDLGSLLCWPEIFDRFEDPAFMIERALKEGYLWKRAEHSKQFNLRTGEENLPYHLLEGSTYLGGIYRTLKEAPDLAIDRELCDRAMKEQLDILRTNGTSKAKVAANNIYGILKKYSPALPQLIDEKKDKKEGN